jgi:hypothetical protein
VLVYKAQKGGGSASEIGQRIAAALMTNPQAILDLKAAADGISLVPAELRDLSLTEILELLATAGSIAAECSKAIKE